MFNFEKSIENGKALYMLEGRLDTVTAPEFEEDLKESIDGVGELTLDFEKLDYISSAGLRVLLSTCKIMNDRGTMRIVHVSEAIMDIFEITGFSEILTIE